MTRFHVLCVAAVLLQQPSSAAADDRATVLARVVAVVDDTAIWADDVDRLLGHSKEAHSSEARRAALEELIDNMLIDRAATALGLTPKPGEIDRAIAEILQLNHISKERLEAAVRDQGYTMRSYRAEIGRQLVRRRAMQQLLAPPAPPDPDDVRARLRAQGKTGAPTEAELDEARRVIQVDLIERARRRWIEEARRWAHIEVRL